MSIEDFVCPPALQRFLDFQPEQLGATPANLQMLEELLREMLQKTSGNIEADRRALEHFQSLCGLDEELVAAYEQRLSRSLENEPLIRISVTTGLDYEPGATSSLSALLTNTTGQWLREVKIRFSSPDLHLSEHAQSPPFRLVGEHETLPVSMTYEAPERSMLAVLFLEADVCDQQGEWHAYHNRHDVLLRFPDIGSADRGVEVLTTDSMGHLNSLAPVRPARQDACQDADLLIVGDDESASSSNDKPLTDLETALPIELELDPERTRSLQDQVSAPVSAKARSSSRGTPLTRALLRSQNPQQAPERIELVSRPFMVFGRYNENTGKGFGDFSLGFLPDYGRISRLQCTVCAMDDGLAAMHVSGYEHSYTGLNSVRLIRGRWQRLESKDILDICGLYRLKVGLAWDLSASATGAGGASLQGQELGVRLLDVIDLLKQLDKTGTDSVKQQLKTSYGAFMRMQHQAAQRNGVDSPGPLLYARFYREDAAQRRVTHIYLPKWLPMGSSQLAGLQIDAEGVVPQHAELQFKDGMYWIQNLAGPGEVRVGAHPLGSEEILPLEDGDTIDIGTARFTFEGY